MPVLAIPTTKQPSEWSDRQLLRRVLLGRERAWNELLRRYRSLIYRCITKTTAKYATHLSDADIDEIYAEVLLQLWRNDMSKLRQFNPGRGTKLGSWIGLISCNAAYDHLRTSSRTPMLDRGYRSGGTSHGRPSGSINGSLDAIDPHAECNRTPLDVLIEKERWDHLNQLLASFSPKDRLFLDLYYQKGMDAAGVADHMAISLKTVYSKKHKIRAHLRRCLERMRGECAIRDLAHAA